MTLLYNTMNFSFSMQAKVLAILYLIVTLFGIVASIFMHAFGIWAIIGNLVWIGLAALIVYDTDCLTSGNCNGWSTIRTTLYAIFPILGLIAYIVMFSTMFSKNKSEAVKSEESKE